MLVRRDLEEFVPVPEGRIHFVKSGSGHPVVLLHTLGTSTWAWHTVMDSLGQHFTCYAFDMLGHGESDAPCEDFGIPDWARSMDHAMQVMNIHRAHIIGNSVGGMLAVELAASFPDRVDRLVLVGTPAWDPFTAPQRLKEAEASYDENGIPRPRTLEELKAAGSFANPRAEWVEKTNELRAQAGIWVHKTQQALVWYDMMPRLARVRAAATLVVNGDHDPIRECQELLYNNIPNAYKVVVPGTGHYPPDRGPGGIHLDGTSLLNLRACVKRGETRICML